AAARKALPAGATLVELVRFRPRDFTEVCAGREGQLPARYAAFVIREGAEEIALIDLGSAAELERRGGRELRMSAVADRLGYGELIVASDGRLGLSDLPGCAGPEVTLRELCSGRELLGPQLTPIRPGWLKWLRGWFGG